jgi:hypothetical protein
MRSIPAARSPRGKQPPERQLRPRRGRAAFALAALASIAFLVGACGGSPASSSSTTTGSATSGTGAVTRSGSGSGSQSGNTTTTGGYSVAFAECMRAHGVAKFPNPNGTGNQLGPDSGVNLASSAYQAALNDPCESLAPAGWVSSGPITKGGGS